MRIVDLIAAKRDGGELSRADIKRIVRGVSSGEIPDYQTAALVMAVLFQGMTIQETIDMTLAMAHSGDIVVLDDTELGTVVDKHSTGGVGDKTTLVVAPLVSACGARVGKMSGRGLGHSGGTLDKMESFPGFRAEISTREFKKQLNEIGIVLCGQTADLAPADGKLYALRDVTATVPATALIASSVMSKKIAGGAHAIVLDVKFGSGSFVETLDAARELGELMVSIGNSSGRRTVALLSDMHQPLGWAVGNVLEVQEALDTLRGEGPPDFTDHCLKVASQMLVMAGLVGMPEEASEIMEETIASGRALRKFRQLVGKQGGETRYVDYPDQLPKAGMIEQVTSSKTGYVARFDARAIGDAAVMLGAGRATKNDVIDLSVGFVVHRKVGDQVKKGDPLFSVHANDQDSLQNALVRALDGVEITDEIVQPLPLFHGVLG